MSSELKEHHRSVALLLAGFVVGVAMAVGLLVVTIALVPNRWISGTRDWMTPAVYAALMIVAAGFAWSTGSKSSFFQGMVTALGVALLLNTICGIALNSK